MKNLTKTILVVLAALSSYATASIITIDDFSDNQASISTVIGQSATSSVLGSMIGGERDIIITAYDGLFPSMGAMANVSNGAFSFNADSTVGADFKIQWDGIDGSGAINTNGLATAGVGVDISELAYFQTSILFADFDYFFATTVWWNNGTESETVTLLGPGNSDYTDLKSGKFSFDLFANADFTDVSALQVAGNVLSTAGWEDDFGQPIQEGQRVSAFDVTVAQVDAVPVPEPGSLMLLGGALLGLSRFGRGAV